MKLISLTFYTRIDPDDEASFVLLVAVAVEHDADVVAEAVDRGQGCGAAVGAKQGRGHVVLLQLHVVGGGAVCVARQVHGEEGEGEVVARRPRHAPHAVHVGPAAVGTRDT